MTSSADHHPEARLEVLADAAPLRSVGLDGTPFQIGRGSPGPLRLALDDARVSRSSAEVVYSGGRFSVRDLGQRNGLFLNGRRVEESAALTDGDTLTFGAAPSVRVVFRSPSGERSLTSLLSRLDESVRDQAVDPYLQQLNLLLEATALLEKQLPTGEVLSAMVDQAIRITRAERGALLEASSAGGLEIRIRRRLGGGDVPASEWTPSWTAIDQAMGRGEALVELDLDQGGGSMKTATSIVDQQLRSVIAIPLYSRVRETGQAGQPVGLLYLDSRRPAAFEGLGRRVLDALAIEAASVIDNARMVTRERERREMEQDLEIARHIQERLLPRELGRYGEFEVSGCNRPCHAVGGDYFDVVGSGPDRIAFVIADVVGKGLSAALLTAMLQGGFAGITLTPEPGRLVEHLNRYVWGRSEPNRYATAFIGVLDAEGQMDYINAGHLPALLVAPNGIAKRLESGSHPVGMFADTVFHPGRVALSRGETLVLFTDGVTEATSREGEEFGLTRLTRLVESVSDRPVAAIQTAILEAVEEFTAGREAEDDLTVLIVRYGRA